MRWLVVLVLGVVAATVAEAQSGDEGGAFVRTLVGRLDLTQYKSTIKGLTQFGDRRQGTARNRDAVAWIEAWLQAVGCTSTERIVYHVEPEPRRAAGRVGGARPPVNPTGPTATGGAVGRNGSGPGGSSIFGYRRRTRPVGPDG